MMRQITIKYMGTTKILVVDWLDSYYTYARRTSQSHSISQHGWHGMITAGTVESARIRTVTPTASADTLIRAM